MANEHEPSSWANSLTSNSTKNDAPLKSTNERTASSGSGSKPTRPPHSNPGVPSKKRNKKDHFHDATLINHGSKSNSKSEELSRFQKSISFKKNKFKPPKRKANFDVPQYNYTKFPWNELFKKANDNDDSTPSKFETNGPIRRITTNEDSELSKETVDLFEKRD